MKFDYIASTPDGRLQRGSLEASSKGKVAESLRQKNLVIISINPADMTRRAVSGMRTLGLTSLTGGRISAIDRITFCRHLSIMLRSGLPLVEALMVIQEQSDNKKMKAIVSGVLKSVTNGETLAQALGHFPRAFAGVLLGMVKVGEASGTLERNIEYAANELEKDYELVRKVRAAMIYPVIVLSATVVLGAGMSIFILPKLVKMFKTFNITLPLATRIFLGIANFLVAYGWFVLIGLVGVVILIRVMSRASATKVYFHRFYLTIPGVNSLIRNLNTARITRVLSILLKSGVPINDSLHVTAEAIDNACYQQELERAMTAVQRGKTLASVLTNQHYVPKMANKMIDVGERTGKLDDSLGYLGTYYESEVDHAVKNLTALVEPVILVVIGVVLGFLAIAIISPIYQFTGSIQG